MGRLCKASLRRSRAGPELLGPAYTHRIAISERRLVSFDGERVRFRYKDYRDGDQEKVMELDADEFLRRYLRHVLPERLVRIRYFGFMANRVRTRNLALAREQLGAAPPQTAEPEQDASSPRCPQCHVGSMITIEMVDPKPLEAIDSS